MLFGRDKSTVSRHLKNIFAEEELDRNSVVAKIATTAADGKQYGAVQHREEKGFGRLRLADSRAYEHFLT